MDAELWGDYTVVKKLGEGGMAKVYLAHPHDIPDHRVVLKELKDARHGERFKSEARNLARLRDHPGICHLYHFFPRGEKTVLVTEYIEGATLDEIVLLDSRLDISTIIQVGMDILDVLVFAHDKRVYHRDLKPSNIMVDVEGKIKVIDFGIAKYEDDPDQTVPGAFLGTPQFAPPEQFCHDARTDWAQCDIYSLGVTLFYCLTDRLPFNDSSPWGIIEAKRISDPPAPSTFSKDTPPELDRVVLRSLARLPEDRYSTAAEMKSDLSLLRSSILIPQTTLLDTVEWAMASRAESMPHAAEQVPARRSDHKMGPVQWTLILAAATAIAFLLIFDPAGWFGPQQSISSAATGTIAIQTGEPIRVFIDDSLLYLATLSREIAWDTGKHTVMLVPSTSPLDTFRQEIVLTMAETLTVPYVRGSGSSDDSSVIMDSGDVDQPPLVDSIGFSFTASLPVDVYWDGSRVGRSISSGTVNSIPGTHILELRDPNFPDRRHIDTLELGALKHLSRTYNDPFVPQYGELRVGSNPLGALIHIDGVVQKDRTPYTFRLALGQHRIGVADETQGLAKETTLTVVPGEVTRYIVEF